MKQSVDEVLFEELAMDLTPEQQGEILERFEGRAFEVVLGRTELEILV